MRINWKRMISGALAFTMTATFLLGCGRQEMETIKPMEAEQSKALSFDIIGGKDVMPIGGYYGPYTPDYSSDGESMPEYVTEEIFQAMEDCGVNMMLFSNTEYGYRPDVINKMLDLGDAHDIGIVVKDSEVIGLADVEGGVTKDKVMTRISEYMNHPAFAGIYLVDEPYTATYNTSDAWGQNIVRYKDLAPMLNQELGIFTYTNAFGSGITAKQFELYEEYLNEFCDVLQPNYLLYDRYPFDKDLWGMEDRYFYDLATVRKVAGERDIPFWTFIQAGSQWNDKQERFDSEGYYPNEAQFDWNINTALAFGAQGIAYFPLVQPYFFAWAESTAYDFERNGIFGAWGNKTRWYYYAQNIQPQLEAIDEVLMNSVNKGVIASGEDAIKQTSLAGDAMIEGTSWRELKDIKGDAMVGCFNYQGKTALYVVNFSWDNAQKLELTFQDKYDVTVIQGAERKDATGNALELDLAAGEGALVVFGGK